MCEDERLGTCSQARMAEGWVVLGVWKKMTCAFIDSVIHQYRPINLEVIYLVLLIKMSLVIRYTSILSAIRKGNKASR